MFTELLPLLERRQLLLTITQIKVPLVRVTLTPLKTKEGEDQSLTTPLVVEGTVDELDRDLGKQLSVFTVSHSQLESTLTEAKAEMDAAAKAARDKAKKATALVPPQPGSAGTAVPAKAEAAAPQATLLAAATPSVAKEEKSNLWKPTRVGACRSLMRKRIGRLGGLR